MFRWCQKAAKCDVYMDGVALYGLDLAKSKWFTRGWISREPIAPYIVKFYAPDGDLIGTNKTPEREICTVTDIPREGLDAENLLKFSVAEELSWMENRTATHVEDRAYCLFGLLGVSHGADLW